ncbi:two-component sensor histidine kinase [Tianweitania sp. Rool2]|uniref:histidine kinase n=2 Tax=Oryzicola mucosus TaxID=2767425 RepID=A0A8J6PH25_9HYPH|nr:two-component sensor histidine kinase [Oryzicola mucosus]
MEDRQVETVSTRALARLRQNGWLAGASCAAIIAVSVAGQVSGYVAAFACLAVLAVAAMAPGRETEAAVQPVRLVPEANPLEPLSAVHLAAAVADPLVVFDAYGAVVHANDAARRAFDGMRAGLSLPLRFRAPEMQSVIEGALAGDGTVLSVDYSERLPVERSYHVTASPVGHDTGLYVLVFRDQSEARRIDRMRADFIANASHELRTPLASISGFIETILGPARNDPKAQANFLGIMQEQTGRMSRLIDDLLSLSRLEMKPYLRPGQTVDVKETLEAVISSLTPLMADTGMALEREFGEGSFLVSGDRDELFQVLQNLLENACKYGRSGGRVVVQLEKAVSGGVHEVVATIRDFGPGIPQEHIPRITERFYRVDVETSRTQKGTGLGLSIVKHILTRHGGRLTIRSEVGKGSSFAVHLPIA